MVFLLFLVLRSDQRSLIVSPEIDFLSLSLALLSLWLVIFIVLASFSVKTLSYLLALFKLILIALCLRFCTSSFLRFYVFFEASLIPIFLIILTLGYQPERLLASLIMFFYTLTSSFPLLATLLVMQQKNFSLAIIRNRNLV